MTAAIFGLAGVIVGALLSSGMEMGARGSHSTIGVEASATAGRCRTVRDLRDADGNAQRGMWGRVYDQFLPIAAWEAHRATLARELPETRWSDLSTNYAATKILSRSAARAQPGEPLGDADIVNLRNVAENTLSLYFRARRHRGLAGVRTMTVIQRVLVVS